MLFLALSRNEWRPHDLFRQLRRKMPVSSVGKRQNMALQAQITEDLTQAMRDKDNVAKLALRAVKTAITEAEKNSDKETLSNDEIEQIVQREAKRRRDAAAEYEKAGQPDRIAEELAELTILERYLPKQLSESEIEDIVRETIAEVGATSMADMSKVMPAVMPKVSGRADGKAVNQAVRKLLG